AVAEFLEIYENGWDQDTVQAYIREGLQYELARLDEYFNPTIYRVSSHDCEASIFVPDVKVVDNCSDVHSVKAMVEVAGGGIRSVALVRTNVETKLMANGETCYVYTYSHLTNPIRVPFNGCDAAPVEVRYDAADECWNQSEWRKYINLIDETPLTVVTDRAVNVPLNSKIAWVHAETFDEGSWDNCAIELMLARRSDWIDCIDVCGVVGPNANDEGLYDSWVDILDDLGIPRAAAAAAAAGQYAYLDHNAVNIDDISTFLNQGEVEEYFFNQIVWLWEDNLNCG